MQNHACIIERLTPQHQEPGVYIQVSRHLLPDAPYFMKCLAEDYHYARNTGIFYEMQYGIDLQQFRDEYVGLDQVFAETFGDDVSIYREYVEAE